MTEPGNKLMKNSECYRTETARTLEEHYGKHVEIYTDASKMGDKMRYAIVKEEHTIRKRILPQNTMISAEKSAIIGAIQSKKNNRHKIVIIMDSLSTIMAAESHTPTKNPTIRKMLENDGPRITLLWVRSHKGLPGNEKTDQAVKEALDENISTNERYPTDDLQKWLTEDELKKRDQRWKNGNNEMKKRKKNAKRTPRKEQVAISRLKIGYTRATHGPNGSTRKKA
jgi:ribonuclease HI